MIRILLQQPRLRGILPAMRKPLSLLAALLALAAAPAKADSGFPMSADDKLVQQGRMLIAREHPEVIRHMMRNDGFGGANSMVIAPSMLSAAPDHIAAARTAMKIEPHGRGMWLIRFPYVNVALIETKHGLVLFDTGYAAIGPVLAEVIPTLSPKPDIMFRDTLSLQIDGERFDFHHDPAETEEYIWMSVPSRQAVFTADYYQGFLPNAGNGKRIMRNIDEWAAALRKMAALHPAHLIPMHNLAIDDAAQIDRVLTLNAEALEHISAQVVTRLNAGKRKDAIAASVDWPARFANAPELDPQYNRPEDIARMVAMRWTGWWDDIPSHFAAMRFEDEAREALRLAGGLDAVERRALELLPTDTKLAARLADWAYYGAPDDPRAMKLAIKVYLARISEPGMPLQESQVYFSHAALVRARLEALQPPK